MDFASDSYLKVEDLETVLNGGTIADPGVANYSGEIVTIEDPYTGPDQTSTVTVNFADGSTGSFNIDLHNGDNFWDDLAFPFVLAFGDIGISASGFSDGITGSISLESGVYDENPPFDFTPGPNIVNIETTSGFDITTAFGITLHSSSTSTGGLRSTDADTALEAASDLTAVTNNVKAALGRIGNISQTLDSRTEFITSSITNNSASISHLFDADMAMEELNSTKSSIGSQVGTLMLSQLNTSPQQVLSLFR